MQKTTSLLLCVLLLLICTFALPLMTVAAEIDVFIDGEALYCDIPPLLSEEYRLFVPLRSIAEGLGFVCDWDADSNAVLLYKAAASVSLKVNSNYYFINGQEHYGEQAPFAYNGRTMVPIRTLCESLNAKVDFQAAQNAVFISTNGDAAPPPETSLLGKTVVLDAGHGSMQPGNWTDPGAIGQNGLNERDTVMDVVYKTAAILQNKGASVILTRCADYTYLSLAERADIARQYTADAFIAVHCNANDDRSYKGTATYTRSDSANSLNDLALAQSLQKSLVAALNTRDAGIYTGYYAVLKNLPSAGVIAELAFISNLEEEKLLSQDSFRTKAAQGLAYGIENYLLS